MEIEVTVKMTADEYAEFQQMKLVKLLEKEKAKHRTIGGRFYDIGIYPNGATAGRWLTYNQAVVVFGKFKLGMNDKEIKRISDFIDKQNVKW